MPETKKKLVKSPSLLYHVDHHTASGKRVVDTSKPNIACVVRKMFIGQRQMDKRVVLAFIKYNSRWKHKAKITSKSTVSIRPLPNMVYRLAFWVSLDGVSEPLCASWRQLGYVRASQLELF